MMPKTFAEAAPLSEGDPACFKSPCWLQDSVYICPPGGEFYLTYLC